MLFVTVNVPVQSTFQTYHKVWMRFRLEQEEFGAYVNIEFQRHALNENNCAEGYAVRGEDEGYLWELDVGCVPYSHPYGFTLTCTDNCRYLELLEQVVKLLRKAETHEFKALLAFLCKSYRTVNLQWAFFQPGCGLKETLVDRRGAVPNHLAGKTAEFLHGTHCARVKAAELIANAERAEREAADRKELKAAEARAANN